MKQTIGKYNIMNLKAFCTAQEIISEVKRKTTEWKRIFDNYTSDTEVISRIHKELKEQRIK